MTSYFLTPRHELMRDDQSRYKIRNRETGTEQGLDKIDSFLLDQELRSLPLGQWDNVLGSWEGVS